MRGAYLRGMGLSCALGTSTETCISAIPYGPAQPGTVALDDLAEPLRLAFCRIPDGAELFHAARCSRLVTAAARAAVERSGLTAADIRRLPLFVGSSCFSVGQSETEYAQALAWNPQHAHPMPLCGYQDIAVTVQQTLGCAGDTYTYNTACTSSANALLGALRMLKLGWHRHALVLGVELANRTSLAGFAGLQLLAESLKPFDAARRGLVLG
ncbi:MAG: beta-ketoacyl synthase N-terminal-like domain-containing protein, partial [Gammaproteobacteria bacterium]